MTQPANPLGPHGVRENERLWSRTSALDENIKNFSYVMVGAQGLEPWTR